MGYPLREKDFHKVECRYYMKNKTVNLFFRILYRRLHIAPGKRTLTLSSCEEWRIYFAPQWHALSRSFVQHMLHQLDDHPEILQYFKHTFAPDELMIPTILFNSPFAQHALRSDFPEDAHYNDQAAIHYLNYEPVIEVLDEKSYEAIISSNKCFMRKAISGKSDLLLSMLDAGRSQA